MSFGTFYGQSYALELLEVLVSHHLLKSPKLNIYNIEATLLIANWF